MSDLKILVKLPTRGRPKQCRDVVTSMRVFSQEKRDYLISVDEGDTPPDFTDLNADNVHVVTGKSDSKIHAVNRDVNEWKKPWDILVVASDDMWPIAREWDRAIVDAMALHFPDLDGMLWFPDGYTKNLCTMPIMGRRYYNRFGFVYHPSYRSEWCDNEQMEVAQAHGKMVYIDRQLFEHRHPANTKVKLDSTYTKAMTKVSEDKDNYKQRRAKGFPQ